MNVYGGEYDAKVDPLEFHRLQNLILRLYLKHFNTVAGNRGHKWEHSASDRAN